MKPFDFEIPTRILYGLGAIETLPDEIQKFGRKPLIVTDPGLVKGGVVERVAGLLNKADIAFATYDLVEPNPTIANVHDSAGLFKSENCDCLIGLGG